MRLICFGLVLLLCPTYFAVAQQHYKIVFHIFIDEGKVPNDSTYYKLNANDSILIQTLKFYVSNIQFLKNSNIVFKEQSSYHLIDFANPKSLLVDITTKHKFEFNAIRFDVGIDSIANCAGAMSGDLDPTKGMYWTWQSGYINFKLEGNTNLCNTANNEFQFHLGGYQHPFNMLQTVVLATNGNNNIDIDMNLKKLLLQIDFKTQSHIMSPCNAAKAMSQKVSQLFSIHK